MERQQNNHLCGGVDMTHSVLFETNKPMQGR